MKTEVVLFGPSASYDYGQIELGDPVRKNFETVIHAFTPHIWTIVTLSILVLTFLLFRAFKIMQPGF